MLNKGPAVSPAVATAVIGLIIGGICGYYGRTMQETASNEPPPAGAQRQAGGGPGMAKMGGGGGGGGGGGAQQPTGTRLLPGLVRNIATIEKVQNKGLTLAQSQTVLPILKEIQSADKLTDKDCDEKIAKINAILTEDQKQALKDLTPQRGGGGGGRGGGGAPGMGGGMGAPGSGGPSSGGGKMAGGGGAAPDPDKPFASERNKKALEDLMASLQTTAKK